MNLVVLPIIVPLLAAVLSMLLRNHMRLQRGLAVIAMGTLTVIGALLLWRVQDGTILTMAMGGWQAPYGIVFVADALAAIMVLVAGIIGFATSIYSLADIGREREKWGYHPLLHILVMGVCGAFLTSDLFNLFVWFEVLLIASFVLLALGGTRAQMEGAIKYVIVNLFASAMFLAAIGIIYGLAGTVNMADLSIKLAGSDKPGLVTTVAMLLLVAFGIKSAVFPLFFWLPSSYHAPPAAVSAIFAGLLTKVGVYALLRTFTLIFTQDVAYTHTLLLVIAVLTMVTGVLGAVAQDEVRRVLSFHIISQIGYMILGLALFTPLAIAGAVFYVAHHIIVKANLFFVGGIAYHLHGTYRLDKLGALARSSPLLALLFLIPALSLAGIPPLSGFWAKFVIVRAGLDAEAYIAVGAALAVGLLTLFSMTKIWAAAFWKPLPEATPTQPLGRGRATALMLPVVFLAAITVAIGLVPQVLFGLSHVAAGQLMDPSQYVEAVLGVQP